MLDFDEWDQFLKDNERKEYKEKVDKLYNEVRDLGYDSRILSDFKD